MDGYSLVRLDRQGGGGVQRDFGGGGAGVRDEWLWRGLNRCFELFNNFFKKFLKPGGIDHRGHRERRVGQGVPAKARWREGGRKKKLKRGKAERLKGEGRKIFFLTAARGARRGEGKVFRVQVSGFCAVGAVAL